MIESKDNKSIKLLKSLLAKKGRKAEGLYIAEGKRIVEDSKDVQSIFVNEDYDYHNNLDDAYNQQVQEGKISVVSNQVFELITQTQHSQGIIAIVKISESQPDPSQNSIYLENIQDPGNMGTILRSATSFDFQNIICSKDCVDIFSPKVVRSAMGAIQSLNITQDADFELIPNKKIVATVVQKQSDTQPLQTHQDICLMIGNEGNGLTDHAIDFANQKSTLPTTLAVESLNAAVAASIAMYESFKNKKQD
jgi:TrmH family RNA methyltransferase